MVDAEDRNPWNVRSEVPSLRRILADAFGRNLGLASRHHRRAGNLPGDVRDPFLQDFQGLEIRRDE
jgi:hypothetical protein